MTRLLQMTLLASSLVLLGGCGAASSGSAAPSPSAPEGQVDTAHSSTSAAGTSGGVLATSAADTGPIATLTRSGGIQGKTETLVVRGDGMLQLLNGDIGGQVVKTAQAPQAQRDSLAAAFASSEWRQLAAQYGKQVPDGFAYTINGGSKQVVTYDGAQNPPVLESVLNQLNALWQIAQSAP